MQRFLGSVLALSVFAGAAPAQYRFTTIDAPGTTSFTMVHGINNRGQIVGVGSTADGEYGFLYSAGSFTPLAVAGARVTDAQKINDAGQIVGFSVVGLRGPTSGFLFEGGTYTTLMVPGAVNTLRNRNGGIVVSATKPRCRDSPTKHLPRGTVLDGAKGVQPFQLRVQHEIRGWIHRVKAHQRRRILLVGQHLEDIVINAWLVVHRSLPTEGNSHRSFIVASPAEPTVIVFVRVYRR